MTSHYRWQGENLMLFCHIQPGASRAEFAGLHGERLKIRIAAAPTEGRANKQLQQFLAKACGVKKQAVEITSGAQSRQKTLTIRAPVKLPAALQLDAAGPATAQ